MKFSTVFLLLLLLSLTALACGFSSSSSGVEGNTADLPTGAPVILYQPGLLDSGVADGDFGLFLLDPTAETATEWKPGGSGALDIWAGTAEDYQYVQQPTSNGRERRILFVGANGEFAEYTVPAEGDFSPDGRYHIVSMRGEVAVRRVGAPESEIEVLAQNGSGSLSWSPDSERVLFPVTLDDGGQQMILHELATSRQTVVLETAAEFRAHIWSPDGRAFAFTEYVGQEARLYQYATEGLTQLSADVVPVPAPFSMRFMPDGRSVVIASGPTRVAEIYQMFNDGGGVVRRYEVEGTIRDLRPSGDGRWILFEVGRASDDTFIELTLLPADSGSAVVHMIEAPVSRIIEAEFSPDGQKLALVIGLDNPRNGVDELWLVDLAAPEKEAVVLLPQGGGPGQVWVERDGKLAYIGYAGVSNFVWSADSSRLYVMAGLEDSCETSGTISFELVPSPDVEINCRFAFYEVAADGTAVNRIGEFETAAMPVMRSEMFWIGSQD